jgi:hypothetical protein
LHSCYGAEALRGKGRRVQRVITLNGDSTPYSRMKFTAGED